MSRLISVDEVKKHKHKSIWMIIHNDVYDVTEFLNEHPGGADSLLDYAGKDGTQGFEDVGHSSDAREMMQKYKIGTLPPGEQNKFIVDCLPSKDCSTCDDTSSKLKWALLALAGALVVGFVLKKYMA